MDKKTLKQKSLLELFESGSMLHKNYEGYEQFLMNEGGFIELAKKFSDAQNKEMKEEIANAASSYGESIKNLKEEIEKLKRDLKASESVCNQLSEHIEIIKTKADALQQALNSIKYLLLDTRDTNLGLLISDIVTVLNQHSK